MKRFTNKPIILFLFFAFLFSLFTSKHCRAQVVTTLAGSGAVGSANGTGTAATFNYPDGLSVDGNGNLYVGDVDNNEIRKIVISNAVVTTLAGSTVAGSANGTGTAASFKNPYLSTNDGNGNLYVSDNNNEIRKIVISSAVVTTLAGSTTAGSANGTGTAASFNGPAGIVYDGNGNLYMADFSNNEIRKIVISSAVVTTFVGSITAGSVNGTGTAASFHNPNGLTIDGNGNLYVADEGNNEIRKIVISSAAVTTLAGSGIAGSANGIGTAASFNSPTGVACDGSGNLFVADADNNKIRLIVISTGQVITYAGSGTAGSANGAGTAATFDYPWGIATDATGNVYVGEDGNNDIRKITPPPAPIAGFKASTTSVCTGIAVQFTDTSHNSPTSWQWTFQGGTPSTSTVQNPSVIYNAVGTDSVKLVVTNGAGKDSITKKLYITVNTTPAAPTASSNSPICAGDTLKLNATNTGTTYSWKGPNSFTSATENPDIVAVSTAATGTYSVTTTTSGCTSPIATTSVTINAVPVLPTASSNSPICKGATLNLTSSSAGATKYSWTGPGSFSSKAQDTSITSATTAAAGTYSVSASNTCGTSSVKTISVIVDTVAPAAPVLSSNSPVCSGATLTLTSSSAGATSYNWTGPNSFSSVVQNPLIAGITTASTGTYSGTATNGCGTSVAGTTIVNVNPLPSVNISGETTICSGLNDTLTANATGNSPFTYSWSTAGTSDTAIISSALLTAPNTAIVSTLAGSATSGSVNGTGSGASFDNPFQTVIDGSGNMYVADEVNNLVRKIVVSTGVVTTLAGSGVAGSANGTGVGATFNYPSGVALDGNGNLYVAEGNDIRKIVISNAVVTTLAGSTVAGSANGTGAGATFNSPFEIASDGNGNLYVTDTYNNEIRKIVISSGAVTTVAGSVNAGSANGTGTSASFDLPIGLTIDGGGNLYVGDYKNNEIRKIVVSSGVVSTFAGSLTAGHANGTGTAATFDSAFGVQTDGKGNLYVADTYNNEIRKIVISSGAVTTLAGNLVQSNINGTGTTATFNLPVGVSTDAAGNLYVSELNDVRKTVLEDIYTVTVDDKNGCKNSASTTITINTIPSTPIVSGNSPICAGGTLNLSASSPGATSYSWTGPNSFSSATENPSITGTTTADAGTYSVKATDACGTSPANSVTVTVNTPPVVSVSGPDTICSGSTATLSANGATTYTWSTGTTGSTINVSPTVTTTYTVTGANGTCDNAKTITVTVYSAPTVSVSPTAPSICPGSSITLSASGASTYTWSPAAGLSATTGSSVTATPAGTTTYTVTGISALGCTAKNTVMVSLKNALVISVKVTPSTCGKNNGTITATVTGGTSPYTYAWSNGDTLATADSLGAGIYNLTVIDKNGCSLSQSQSITVSDTNGPSITLSSVIENRCFGASNGAINITVSGGKPPYKYSWSNGATTANISGLANGPYKIKVTDTNGCSDFMNTITITSPPAIALTTSVTSAACGSANGNVSVSATGGTAPYLYSWNTSATTSSISNIGAGTYIVTVTDKNGCKDSADASVSNTSGPVVNINSIVADSCTTGNTGSISISVSGGASPYNYVWSNGATTSNIGNLAAGTYNVTVTDSTGCKGTANAQVSNTLPSGISICIVSVDTESMHNIIVWDKTGLTGIDSLKLYYLNYLSVWQLIKTVPFSAPDYIVDSTPINDPNANTVRYCLTAVSSCGTEEPIPASPWQNTMHIIQPSAGTFLWTGVSYLKEAVDTPVISYFLYRDSLGNGNWKAIDSVSGTQNTMNDVNYQKNPGNYPASRWYVGAMLNSSIGTGCTIPLLKPEKINNTTTRSNTQHNITLVSGVSTVISALNSVLVYPNPAGQNLNIKFNYTKAETARISIVDVMGKTVCSMDNIQCSASNPPYMLNVGNLAQGVYFVKVSSNSITQVVKFVKE
ncbi:MAG: T9SS type A sorting domain-containing protein [Bacteroidia bacterium]